MKKNSRSKSSERWLKEHFSDQYVIKSKEEGYASRAAYKLIELDDKDHFLKSGMTVVDLGAAPGGWSQVARERVGDVGRVVALDILPMNPPPGVEFIQGDFREDDVLEQLLSTIGENKVDLVISDMAPNLSGKKAIDQPRAMYLVELAWDLAQKILKPGGSLLYKVFQGEGVEALAQEQKQLFKTFKWRKPAASRGRSREVYVLASGYQAKL